MKSHTNYNVLTLTQKIAEKITEKLRYHFSHKFCHIACTCHFQYSEQVRASGPLKQLARKGVLVYQRVLAVGAVTTCADGTGSRRFFGSFRVGSSVQSLAVPSRAGIETSALASSSKEWQRVGIPMQEEAVARGLATSGAAMLYIPCDLYCPTGEGFGTRDFGSLVRDVRASVMELISAQRRQEKQHLKCVRFVLSQKGKADDDLLIKSVIAVIEEKFASDMFKELQ